jgi:hypothetical protein
VTPLQKSGWREARCGISSKEARDPFMDGLPLSDNQDGF